MEKSGKNLYAMLNLGMGIGCAVLFMSHLNEIFRQYSFAYTLIVMLAMMLFSTYVQTVLHEVGHLVFGLKSGYRFLSFRIGNHVWIQLDGKLRHKRFSIPQTAGQCLLVPPDFEDGTIPYKLYLSGGYIMNIVSALVCILVSFLVGNVYVVTLLRIVACVGIFMAVINGYPLHLENVDNDGCTIKMIAESDEALFAFWLQMKVNAEVSCGKRLRDLPQAWFKVCKEEDKDNGMIMTMDYFTVCRYMDQGNFDAAKSLITRDLNMQASFAGIHKHMMLADLVYCKLLDKEDVTDVLTGEYQQFVRAMRNNISIIRTQYASALANGDVDEAERYWEYFEKMGSMHPYPVEVEAERELMHIAKERICLEEENVDRDRD